MSPQAVPSSRRMISLAARSMRTSYLVWRVTFTTNARPATVTMRFSKIAPKEVSAPKASPMLPGRGADCLSHLNEMQLNSSDRNRGREIACVPTFRGVNLSAEDCEMNAITPPPSPAASARSGATRTAPVEASAGIGCPPTPPGSSRNGRKARRRGCRCCTTPRGWCRRASGRSPHRTTTAFPASRGGGSVPGRRRGTRRRRCSSGLPTGTREAIRRGSAGPGRSGGGSRRRGTEGSRRGRGGGREG